MRCRLCTRAHRGEFWSKVQHFKSQKPYTPSTHTPFTPSLHDYTTYVHTATLLSHGARYSTR
jgi:hypothetical protein